MKEFCQFPRTLSFPRSPQFGLLPIATHYPALPFHTAATKVQGKTRETSRPHLFKLLNLLSALFCIHDLTDAYNCLDFREVFMLTHRTNPVLMRASAVTVTET